MANSYMLFSEMIPVANDEQREFVTSLLTGKEPPEDLPDDWDDIDEFDACKIVQESAGIWISTDESGEVERVANAVASWQMTFGIEEPWSLTYATTCSKPRLGEFGGGAVFVYKGTIKWTNAYSWVVNEQLRVANGSTA